MALAMVSLIACSKSKDSASPTSTLPLKAIPTETASGKVITLDASKSTGPITKYGWALDVSSPTYADQTNLVAFSNGVFSHKGGDFVSMYATVTKAGVYAFSLIVYDDAGNQSYAVTTVEVK